MDIRELLEAIVAAPEDDAPRRVYADALLEAGEVQGELIHLQCDLARGGLTRAEAIARRQRERELLATHGDRWTDGLRGIATQPMFRRGFVDEVTVDAAHFPHVGDALFAAAPALRGVMFLGLDDKGAGESEEAAHARILDAWDRVIASAAFRRLRGVGFQGFGYECRVFGEVTPGWESLTPEALERLMATDPALDCLACGYADRGLGALIASPRVRTLDRLAITSPGWQATRELFEALTGGQLRSLAIGQFQLGVLDHPVLATLTELRLESFDVTLAVPTDTLERFALATETIRPEHVDMIAASVRGVRELCLDGRTVPGYRQLARADLLHLRVLRVCGTDIGYAQAVEVLEMPCAAQLEVLSLRTLPDDQRAALENRFGVMVEAREIRPTVYW